MTTVWLRPNRRILGAAALAGLLLLVVGSGLILLGTFAGRGAWAQVLGWPAAVLGASIFAANLYHLLRPRVSYSGGQVKFYLRWGRPVATPIEVVEAFFVGQGPAFLPGPVGKEAETINLIARIAERAAEWHRVEVFPVLGSWCDGYVIIRGTWCEPLNEEVVRRINHELAETKRQLNAR